MDLGAFSVSLAVEDMGASREFYEKLGFAMMAGDGTSWTIMANGTTAIGLFQGMFEGNILTFNPGWTGLGEPVEDYTDVRELRAQLTALGLERGWRHDGGVPRADPPASPSPIQTAT